MQGFFTEASYPLEIIGVIIAVLGFSGADRWVEKILSVAVENWKNNAPIYKELAPRFVPTPKNIKKHWFTALWQIGLFIPIYWFALQTNSGVQDRFEAIIAMGEPWGPLKIVGAIILLPLIAYFGWVTFSIIAALMIYYALVGVWRFIWFLSRPPSGVLGSIGLLVALYNPVARYFMQAVA